MERTTSRTRRIYASAALVVVASAVAATAMFAQPSASDVVPVDPHASYSVLQADTQAPSDRVARSPLVKKMSAERPELGLKPDAASGLRPSVDVAPTATIDLVPSAKAPCLYLSNDAGFESLSCGDESGETAAVGYGWAVGLVPDAVKAITVAMSDGSQRQLPVVDNTWVAPPEAVSVSIQNGSKNQSIDLMPLSSLPAGATILPSGAVRIAESQ